MANKGNGISIVIKDNNIDKALKRFKRKLKKSNLMLEIYQNEFYVKPSTKRRERKLKAVARNKYKIEEFKRDERI